MRAAHADEEEPPGPPEALGNTGGGRLCRLEGGERIAMLASPFRLDEIEPGWLALLGLFLAVLHRLSLSRHRRRGRQSGSSAGRRRSPVPERRSGCRRRR